MTRRFPTVAGWAVGITLLAAVPAFVKNPYYLHVLILIGMYVILSLSLRLIMTTGQINLGHAAFMLVGAFASAMLVMKVGSSFWLAFFLSGIIAAAFAMVVGIPTLRIKGVYFFIVTFALGELLIKITQATSFFGGFYGIQNVPRPDPIRIPGLFTIEFTSKVQFYYLILLIAVISTAVLLRFEKSRLGNIFKAIGGNDSLAASLGINLMGYKLLAFGVGCFFAGLVGSFYGHYNLYISGDSFTVFTTIAVLSYVVVGGLAKFWGPMLGAVFMIILNEALPLSGEMDVIVFGTILIIVILFFPGGIIGLPGVLAKGFRSMTQKRVPTGDSTSS